MYRKVDILRTVFRLVPVAVLGCTADMAAAAGVDPLFQDHSILEVEIEAPFKMLEQERPDEEEVPGKFRYRTDDGELVEFDIELRTRGRVRRDKATCTFPPLRLDFKKRQVADTLFHKQDKLKLVSHCLGGSPRYEQAVIGEYLVYRIYNLLTEQSFQARLLKPTYRYTDDSRTVESYALLIESVDRLEKRLDAKHTKANKVRVTDVQAANLNLTSVFQYFIGNTDFSPIAAAPGEECCHNQELLEREGRFALSIPYDFDQSGLLNVPHAAPNPRFKLRSTRERLYRGRCVNNDYLPATLDLFRERRADIEKLILEQPELNSRYGKSMLDYIDDFYKTIDSPRRLQRNIISQCL